MVGSCSAAPSHHLRRRTLLGALPLIAPLLAAAQPAWPTRSITVIAPSGAGGGLDALARFVAGGISPMLGQPVVVENKPGANGAIGAQAVARAAPDGYTLLMGDVGVLSINPALFPRLPYDPQKELAPIAVVAKLPLVFVTGANSRFTSLKVLLQAARTSELSLGSVGVGNITHLTGANLEHAAGVHMVHVPYKGAPAVLADVASGVVDVTATSVVSAAELIKGGRLRALALAGDKRMPQLPGVPTVAEEGFPGFDNSSWICLHAPAATPPEVVDLLYRSVARLLASAEAREWMDRKGYEVIGMNPEQTRAYSIAEQKRWSEVIRQGNVRAD
ncbi:tripartite tricarboxylate transporter substrate binding protein [Xylophilus sp. GOD-11R]|uniref:Bug family tripartite tricarboxylate transporter substrate binding protein n=1 Tax=Xylophilus sp. GOD-11R TaxID=3089814 RepID=UPI00298C342D|nr:tripartite tricarboxylate transporter substrate binding protein [Xylophilus sp. GOD-11R]WPB58332.1 tripartite tricarboxylate transporter substrate binding protein [Xylophilus sp. GOD-11R]